jgi:hypothetical protein
LTVTDNSGNTATATATITVQDISAPVINSKNPTLFLDATGKATLVVSDVENGSTDNCSISTRVLSATSFTCANIGTNTVTYTVTDGSGNKSTSAITVTIVDRTSPIIVTNSTVTLNLDATGKATLTVANVDNGSTDNCSIASKTLSKTAFDCNDIGNNTIMYTVTDASGNSSNVFVTIVVVDKVAPTVKTKPVTLNLNLLGNTVATLNPADVDNGSTDNCAIKSMTLNIFSFDCSKLGTNLVTLTVTDASGNSATGTAVVTVVDVTAPEIKVNNAVTLALDGNGAITLLQGMIADGSTDNCAIATRVLSKTNFTCADKGPNTVVFTVTDKSGNVSTSSIVVTIIDNIKPDFAIVPSVLRINYDSTKCGANVTWIDPVVADNCSGATVTSNKVNGVFMPMGLNTVTFTATDASGNTRVTTMSVFLKDDIKPVIATSNKMVVNNDAGKCGANVTFTLPTVTDGCGVKSVTANPVSGSYFAVGLNVVTITATDNTGNTSTSTMQIEVVDVEKPVVTFVPANIKVGECKRVVTYSSVTATDNCGAVEVDMISGLASGSVFPIGKTTNAFRIKDTHGNITLTQFVVEIVPQGLPTMPVTKKICENGAPVTLVSGQPKFIWTGIGVESDTMFNPKGLMAGIRKLDWSFIDSMGCTAKGTYDINVMPAPVKPVVTRPVPDVLTTGLYSSYQWYRNEVAINNGYQRNQVVGQQGFYHVVVTNEYGCTEKSEDYGIGMMAIENITANKVRMYPNPSEGVLKIEIPLMFVDAMLEVLDVNGRVVMSSNSNGEFVQTLDLRDYVTDGNYVVRVSSNGKVIFNQIVLISKK